METYPVESPLSHAEWVHITQLLMFQTYPRSHVEHAGSIGQPPAKLQLAISSAVQVTFQKLCKTSRGRKGQIHRLRNAFLEVLESAVLRLLLSPDLSYVRSKHILPLQWNTVLLRACRFRNHLQFTPSYDSFIHYLKATTEYSYLSRFPKHHKFTAIERAVAVAWTWNGSVRTISEYNNEQICRLFWAIPRATSTSLDRSCSKQPLWRWLLWCWIFSICLKD